MIVPAFVLSVGAGTSFFAVRALRATRRAVPDPSVLVAAMASGDPSRIDAAARRLFPADADLDALSAFLVHGTSRLAAIAALNEHLGEVDARLARVRDLPRTLARIAVSSGVLGAVVELARAGGEPSALLPAIASFIAGFASGGVALDVGRRTAQTAERARAGWDQIGRVFSRGPTSTPGGA